MIDIGLVSAGCEDHYGLWWWADHLQHGATELLAVAAAAGEPLPVEVIADAAHEDFERAYDLESVPDTVRGSLPKSLVSGVGILVDRLVWLGAATREGVDVVPDQLGYQRRVGGELDLTDLGRWWVRPVLVAQGYEIRETGELAGMPADVLRAEVANQPLESMHAEVRAWAAARDATADELGIAARQTTAPDRRAMAFEALDVLGDGAVPVVRSMVDEPDLRPWAMLWLAARGDEQPDTVAPSDAGAALVQALAVALVSGGPDTVASMFADAIPASAQAAMVEQLWRVDDPYTRPVLEAIAEEAAERKVAKAARKALFKHRSAASNGPK